MTSWPAGGASGGLVGKTGAQTTRVLGTDSSGTAISMSFGANTWVSHLSSAPEDLFITGWAISSTAGSGTTAADRVLFELATGSTPSLRLSEVIDAPIGDYIAISGKFAVPLKVSASQQVWVRAQNVYVSMNRSARVSLTGVYLSDLEGY